MPGIKKQVARALGVAAGAPVALLLLPFMIARRIRLLHPVGVIHTAWAVPPPGVLPGASADLAARLAGPVLVRFSGGLHAHPARQDSLGLGLRFHSQPMPSAVSSQGDQDLTLITLRSFSFKDILAGLREAHAGDYLDNTYGSIWPYEVDGFGSAFLRIKPEGAGAPGEDREERLLNAVKEGRARLHLEIAQRGSETWLPVAEIRIGPRLSQAMAEAFRMNPSSAGRGLHPRSFKHGLRVVPYKASQFTRKRLRAPVLPLGERTDGGSLPRHAGVARQCLTS